MTLTGFEMGEIDVLLGAAEAPEVKADPADTVPAVATYPAVTRLGDIWQIGRHRLICGDALAPETYARLLAGEKAEMVFSSVACSPSARPA